MPIRFSCNKCDKDTPCYFDMLEERGWYKNLDTMAILCPECKGKGDYQASLDSYNSETCIGDFCFCKQCKLESVMTDIELRDMEENRRYPAEVTL